MGSELNELRGPENHVALSSVHIRSSHHAISPITDSPSNLRELAVDDVTYTGDCYHVRLKFHGCGFKTILSTPRMSYGGTRKNVARDETRIFLTPHWALNLTEQSYHYLCKTVLGS